MHRAPHVIPVIGNLLSKGVPIGLLGLLIVTRSPSQQAPAHAEFEVASVKPAGPNSIRNSEGGPGSRDPGRYTFTNATLRDLLYGAYGLEDQEQISGPGWIDVERYDISAKIPPGTTREQFQEMLRVLLVERFKLKVHHETKQFPVLELVVGKNGPKLKESAGSPDATGPPPPDRDRNGFPVLPAGRPGLISSFGPGAHSAWTARQQETPELARSLSGPMAAGRHVVDKTGLAGKYDFTLEYDRVRPSGPPGSAAPDDNPGLSIFDAVQRQLGLRLVEGKAFFDVIVVDRAERVPTEN
jgi:uncharacterized protein (TIGR03435 family)